MRMPEIGGLLGGRLAYIDTLRGLASLHVVLYHTALMPSPPLTVPFAVSWLILNGGTGVSLFFVVSAFTLCLSMSQRSHEPQGLQRYFVRRFFRIVPLFYTWVVLSWIRDALVWGVYQPPGRVLLNLLFLYNFVPGEETSFVWAGWTLGVEMIFYLVFPLLFRAAATVTSAVVLVAATIALAAVHQQVVQALPIADALKPSYLQFSFLRMLPVFAFGVLAFRVHERWIEGRSPNRLVSIGLVGGACVGYWTLVHGVLWSGLSALYWQAIVYSVLMLGLSMVPWSLFVNRVTVFLGAISYSLYLTHPTVVAGFFPVYRWIAGLPMSTAVQFAACVLVTVTSVVALSIVSYYLIEAPGIRLGSRLLRPGVTASRAPEPGLTP